MWNFNQRCYCDHRSPFLILVVPLIILHKINPMLLQVRYNLSQILRRRCATTNPKHNLLLGLVVLKMQARAWMFLFFLSFCTCSELYLGINNSSTMFHAPIFFGFFFPIRVLSKKNKAS